MPKNIPDFKTFTDLARQATAPGQVIPVFRRLMSDQLTPVLAYRRLVRPDERMAPSFLLESVIGGDRQGRYSFLGTNPAAQVIARRNTVKYLDHENPANSRSYECPDPLRDLANYSESYKTIRVPGLPDFTGGWVGCVTYDAVRYLEGEKLPNPPEDDRNIPDIHMQLYKDMVIFDNVQKCVLVVTHVEPAMYDSLDDGYQEANDRLEDLVDQLNAVVTQQADQIDFLRSATQDRADTEHPIGPHNDPPPHY